MLRLTIASGDRPRWLVAIGKRQESVASLLVMNVAVMAPTVVATKYGIDSCRTYAKRRLEAEG